MKDSSSLTTTTTSSLKNIRFVRYGDLVLLNESSLAKLGLDASTLSQDDEALRRLKATFRCSRLALKRHINDDDFRSPNVVILRGKEEDDSEPIDPWVVQVDNGIRYCFNIEKSMFCKGNIKEKLRLSKLDCSQEVVVDLFAGIGYFALVFAVHCRARQVFACEWNPTAVEALRRNALLNRVEERVVILEGDNRLVCPVGVASRVNMGLIPSSLASLETACRALDVLTFSRLTLHVHENLTYELMKRPKEEEEDKKSKRESTELARRRWAQGIVEQVRDTFSKVHPGLSSTVEAQEVVCIKSYAPHIDHMVADVVIQL
ncbi:PREDICTED: tRNA wybutosine-synthesizing protein 2 homolog [Rhagoletis zephyria]|uniref:tRNA wybutosine-synthesizing protein 2 homolog n=1 Tax=Rhagoletis zephyria TaxID=28612 RepID=UPI0008119394|nr:PREDICTED: tRNA wybutosine-synthesizing protein 2 homolog [Rhagoletis zephyria]